MKRSKKTILILLGVIALAVVIAVVCIGFRAAPTINYALQISELLQPVLDAQNQRMHMAVSAGFGNESLSLESELFLVSEDGISYLAVEQKGAAVYVADNVLFLENGKAFKIGEKMQKQTLSCINLLPQIGALYEVLNITAEKADNETVYSITVTGEQVATLLAAASLGESLPVDSIETLNLRLTEKNEKLDTITFSGSAAVDETEVQLQVVLSGFRVLASGDYPIPEAVKQSAATVNPEELFSLTEDLYRLVLALAPFADMESMGGTLALSVDCGLIQVNTDMKLSDLKRSSDSRIDPEALQSLPGILGFMCMEGDIRYIPDGDRCLYTLELDQHAMQSLSRMILPELAQHSADLTEGTISIILESNTVASMNVSIKGNLNAWIAQIPVAICAEFTFDHATAP